MHSVEHPTNVISTLGKIKRTGRRNDGDSGFAECPTDDTQQTYRQWTTGHRLLPCAGQRHLAKLRCLPCAALVKLSKHGSLCRVPTEDSRQKPEFAMSSKHALGKHDCALTKELSTGATGSRPPSTCWSHVFFAEGRQKSLGKDLFVECRPSDTRQTSKVRRPAND